MRSYRKELWFHTDKRREFVNITPQVEDCLRESGIRREILKDKKNNKILKERRNNLHKRKKRKQEKGRRNKEREKE